MISTDLRKKAKTFRSARGGRNVHLPKILRWFWIASMASFGLTLLVSYLEFHAGWSKDLWYPLQTPLFLDLLQNAPSFRFLHTAAFYDPSHSAIAYPPFGAIQLVLMYGSGHPVIFYLVIATAGLSLAVWGVIRALLGYGINRLSATLLPVTLVLVSFPIARLLPQGNIELFLWIFAAAGTWAYLQNRDDAAAVLWAFAAASKLYPVILLVLLLPRRKYRAFVVGVVLFVAISVLSMAYLGPSIAVAWRGSLDNVFGYQGLRVSEWNLHDLYANHSFFLLVKFVATVAGLSAASLTKPYYICGGLLFGAVFFGRLRTMPVANQLLGVSVFMLMLPTISYYHTLVHLYAPLLVLLFLALRADRAGVEIPGLSTTVLLFIPLFASFQLLTVRRLFLFCGMVQAVVLSFLFLYALQYPFAEPASATIACESDRKAGRT